MLLKFCLWCIKKNDEEENEIIFLVCGLRKSFANLGKVKYFTCYFVSYICFLLFCVPIAHNYIKHLHLKYVSMLKTTIEIVIWKKKPIKTIRVLEICLSNLVKIRGKITRKIILTSNCWLCCTDDCWNLLQLN